MCRERDSNPHDRFGSRDFKSLVSTNSTIAAHLYGFAADKDCANRMQRARSLLRCSQSSQAQFIFAPAKVRLFPQTTKQFINYLEIVC